MNSLMQEINMLRKSLILCLCLFLLSQIIIAQNPKENWDKYQSPEDIGWSFDEIRSAFNESNSAALMVVVDGKVVANFGDITRKYKTHSVRKSFLNSLYGIYVDKGIIDINKNLGELGITDVIPLYENEKEARVSDLLKARSGIYIPAGAETQSMKDNRPKRLSHEPNTYWYYNNWDFNVLGTIFRRETKKEIFDEFYNQIARPLQMEDFDVIDGSYDYSDSEFSIHPSYPFKMSVRDMARFGQLYLQKGRWNDKQVISQKWIDDTFSSYSPVTEKGPEYDGYGYLWWTGTYSDSVHSYFASGVGGSYIGIFYPQNMVIVVCGDTYEERFTNNRYQLIQKILAAKKSKKISESEIVSLNDQNEQGGLDTKFLSDEERQKFIGEYEGQYIDLYGNDGNNRKFYIMENQEDLILVNYDYYYQYKLFPISSNRFFVEDIQLYLTFEIDNQENPSSPVFHKSLATEKLYNTLVKEGVESGLTQFDSLSDEIRSEFELRFLSDNLKKLEMPEETLEVLRWSVLQFPKSVDMNRAYITTFQKQKGISDLSVEYRNIYKSLSDSNEDTGIILWFLQWLTALNDSTKTDVEYLKQFVGDYGPRHITMKNGSLYYYRDDRSTKSEHRLIKAFDDGPNPVFIFADSYDYFRIKFLFEKGEVIKLIGQYIDGDTSESMKDRK